MDASALEYERVMEKKKQLLIKIQETKTGIRNKQNQLKILEEGLQKIKDQEGKESVGGKLNIFLRDLSMQRSLHRYITEWKRVCLRII